MRFVRCSLFVILCMLASLLLSCSSARESREASPAEPVSSVKQALCSHGAWAQISGGINHTCAITSQGYLYCWGRNAWGQLGDGTTTERHVPTYVMNGVAQVDAKGDHTCAIMTSGGTLKCWGSNSSYELGTTTPSYQTSPTTVTGLSTPIKAVSTGGPNTCVIDTNDDFICWGDTSLCQLGYYLGTPTTTRTLVGKRNPSDTWANAVASIAVQNGTVCGIGIDGTPRCWGLNENGQLGTGSTSSYDCYPDSPSLPFSYVWSVSVGLWYTCWLDGDNSYHPYCAGHNYYGQLGRGSSQKSPPYYNATPGAITGPYVTEDAMWLEANYGYTGIEMQWDGAVNTWGGGFSGELGNGTWNESDSPVRVYVGGNALYAAHVTAGDRHVCALKSDGTLYCWGDNYHGQIGDNTTTDRNTPTSITCP